MIAPGQWYTYQGTTLDQTHKTPVCILLLRCKLLEDRLPAAQITQAARWSGHQPSADDPWGHPSSGNSERDRLTSQIVRAWRRRLLERGAKLKVKPQRRNWSLLLFLASKLIWQNPLNRYWFTGFSVFLDVNSQKANQCLSTLILPAFLAHCPCLRAKHVKRPIHQDEFRAPGFVELFFSKVSKSVFWVF